jgi:hypothetical protein
MTYTSEDFESDNPTVSRAVALRIVNGHCGRAERPAFHAEFFADCGDHDTYSTGAVLGWLGY